MCRGFSAIYLAKVIWDGTRYKLDVNGKILSFDKEYGFGGGSFKQRIEPTLLGSCPANDIWHVGEIGRKYRP